jgi:hypothetical protein
MLKEQEIHCRRRAKAQVITDQGPISIRARPLVYVVEGYFWNILRSQELNVTGGGDVSTDSILKKKKDEGRRRNAETIFFFLKMQNLLRLNITSRIINISMPRA